MRYVGVFVSSWLGGLLLTVGEWIIKKLPLVKHIYSAAKQVRRHGASQACPACDSLFEYCKHNMSCPRRLVRR